MANKTESSASIWKQVGEYSGLAVTLPAAVLIGYGIGYACDRHFKTGHVFTVIFLIFGCAAALIEIVRVAARKQ